MFAVRDAKFLLPDVSSFYFPYVEPTKRIYVDDTTVWEVPQRLQFIEKVGSGSYGIVASFLDKKSTQDVAVKKVGDAFKDLFDAKRILREIRILRHLNHPNIISILDIFPPNSPNFEDIYLVTELMKTDLQRVINSKQDLTEGHLQYFIYQILKGLLYLHSADVLHRDLKPGNILINLNCELKICDFGLARGLDTKLSTSQGEYSDMESAFKHAGMPRYGIEGRSRWPHRSSILVPKNSLAEDTSAELTDYVVTRWYRSPEIILHPHHYDKPIDVWSLGCIFAELLGREAFFAGSDNYDQLRRIINVLGTPDEEDLCWLPSGEHREKALKKLQNFPASNGQALTDCFPKANDTSIDLLEKMLTFNPENRITVEEALEHEYFQALHSPSDEPRCSTPIDWSFDNFKPTKRLLQNRVYKEMVYYNPGIALRDWNLIESYGINVDLSKVLAELGGRLDPYASYHVETPEQRTPTSQFSSTSPTKHAKGSKIAANGVKAVHRGVKVTTQQRVMETDASQSSVATSSHHVLPATATTSAAYTKAFVEGGYVTSALDDKTVLKPSRRNAAKSEASKDLWNERVGVKKTMYPFTKDFHDEANGTAISSKASPTRSSKHGQGCKLCTLKAETTDGRTEVVSAQHKYTGTHRRPLNACRYYRRGECSAPTSAVPCTYHNYASSTTTTLLGRWPSNTWDSKKI